MHVAWHGGSSCTHTSGRFGVSGLMTEQAREHEPERDSDDADADQLACNLVLWRGRKPDPEQCGGDTGDDQPSDEPAQQRWLTPLPEATGRLAANSVEHVEAADDGYQQQDQ